MKLESKDIVELLKYNCACWIGIIKNDGRFGVKQNGVVWFPSEFEWHLHHKSNSEEIYVFKESEFCNLHEYHEAKLILLKNEKTLHENKMNPHTGRPIQVAIPPSAMEMSVVNSVNLYKDCV